MTRIEQANPFAHLNTALTQLTRFQILRLLVIHLFAPKSKVLRNAAELDPKLRRDVGLPPMMHPPDHVHFAVFLHNNPR